MPYHGHVHNGVVVLDEPASLPDGAAVTVLLTEEAGDKKHKPKRCLEGLWADLGIDISDDDIASARREMWGGFPREDLP